MNRPSSNPSQNNSPPPANSRLLKIEIVVGIITIIVGIVGIVDKTTDIFDFKKPSQTEETNTQEILDAA
ncbi:MAG: hypothetical protein F6K39_45510, partial [Okeania sp. SIO3B3]|nr:hypothetical protein [Okeania sp. SIO3B3]